MYLLCPTYINLSVCLFVSLRRPWKSYLVSFESVNKIIRVSQKSELQAKAAAAFGLSGPCAIEYYCKEYETYVRPETAEELPASGKVRLVQPMNVLFDISTASTAPVLSIQSTDDGIIEQQPVLVPSAGSSPR